MRNTQNGFTLIELVVVIVILGILAATALPKFINLSDDANSAAVQGVAGAIASAAAVNYAAKKANSSKGVSVGTCDNATIDTILQGGVPSGYVVSGGSISVDTTVNCVVTKGTFTAAAPVTGV